MYLPKYTCRYCRWIWVPAGQDFKYSIGVYVQRGWWLCKFRLGRIIPSHLWASPGSASALNSLAVSWNKPLPPTYCCTDSCAGVFKQPGAGFCSTGTSGCKMRTTLCDVLPNVSWPKNSLCYIRASLQCPSIQAALGNLRVALNFTFLGWEVYFVTQRGTADFQLLF